MPTEGCWVEVWEHKNYQGRHIRIEGPTEIGKLADVQWPGGGDVHDDIDSLVTGPQAWFIGYEDEYFTDDVIRVGPNSHYPDLTPQHMQDQIDSLRLYDSQPPDW